MTAVYCESLSEPDIVIPSSVELGSKLYNIISKLIFLRNITEGFLYNA